MADNFQYPSTYGRYTLLESIGQGGMSAIDLAQISVTNAQYLRFVVIKRMQAKFTEQENFVLMFKDEARINAELQHNKIAQVYDFGQFGDEYFIAMEYIPGVDLRVLQRELAKQAKGIPIRITLRILSDVCEALYYAHTRLDTYGRPMNVVHRDVNPRNIMISIRGEVKLIDFGVAKADNRLDETVGHTIKGKFAYMSPEQIEGGKVDGRADLFAVALTLHELVDGRRPFAGLNEVQIMHRVLSGNIPPLLGPKDHPQPELVQAIHECGLATEAKDRYPSAGHMQEAIDHAAKACGGLATDAELAAFLRSIMPEETQAIAHRLDRYRKEITQPNGLMSSYENSIAHELPTELFQKTKDSIPPPPTNSPYLSTSVQSKVDETLVSHDSRSEQKYLFKRTLLIGGALMTAGLIVFVLLTQEKSSNSQTNAPRLIQSEPIESTDINSTEKLTDQPKATASEPKPKSTKKQIQAPKVEPVPADQPQVQPSVTPPQHSTVEPAVIPSSASSSESQPQTQAAQNQNASAENNTAAQGQTVSTNAEINDTTEEEETQASAEPVEQAYVFISSVAGQNEIIVKVDGQNIGTLTGPLRTKINTGERTFLFINPSNGREFKQTISISKANQNLISVPEL